MEASVSSWQLNLVVLKEDTCMFVLTFATVHTVHGRQASLEQLVVEKLSYD